LYPPKGTRGVGASMHRATRYGLDFAPHLEAPREGAALLVIIESTLGAANAEDILGVEGVDGVVLGPFDLSADAGRVGDFTTPAFVEAVARVERAASTRGKILGTAPYRGSPADALLARGHRLLIVGSDVSLIREAMTGQLEKARAAFEVKRDAQ
jgi:4-hydroxy-2-oxoheptanedioate aldolase